MKKKMEQKLEETITALAKAFQDESDQEHAEWVKNVVNQYPHLDIQNPEEFSLLTSLTADSQVDLLARTATSHIELDRKRKHKIEFVYKQYSFIERHLESIIVTYEGSMCSTDKTRWLINAYLHYLKTEELPTIEETNYWHPELLDVDQWMRWIDSMQDLYYGNEENYVKEKTVFKHFYQDIILQKVTFLRQLFTTDKHFITDEMKENKHEYCFFDEKTNDKGMIYLDARGDRSWRFFIENEQRWAKWKDRDLLPAWFDRLLKQNKENE